MCNLSEWLGARAWKGRVSGVADGSYSSTGFLRALQTSPKAGGAVGAAGSPVPVWEGWDSQGHPAHAMSHGGVQLWALQRGISRVTGYLCAPAILGLCCVLKQTDSVVMQQVGFRSRNSFLLQHFRAWTWSLCGGGFGGACSVPGTGVLCKVGRTSRDMYDKYIL